MSGFCFLDDLKVKSAIQVMFLKVFSCYVIYQFFVKFLFGFSRDEYSLGDPFFILFLSLIISYSSFYYGTG